MLYKNKTGFTLVELIVVITILAILSTIGFVSYSGYLSGVRDTNRISQLKSMADGLDLYSIKKTLPLPDNYIEIKSGVDIIAYQGYIGELVLEIIDYSSEGLDPKDYEYYSYYLTKDRKGYQLMALLEEDYALTASNLNLNQLNAVDYSNRYPYVVGKKLGILTNDLNIPIQKIDSLITANELDISDVGIDNYKAYLKYDEVLEGSGVDFVYLSNINEDKGKGWSIENNGLNYHDIDDNGLDLSVCLGLDMGDIIYESTGTSSDADLNCDHDIAICNGTGTGYIINSCNAGATTLYINQNFDTETSARNSTINSWAGGLYQWGNKIENSFSSTISTLEVNVTENSTYSNSNFILTDSGHNYDWVDIINFSKNDNLWGDTKNINFYRMGPCDIGYHVPSINEWINFVSLKWDSISNANQGLLMSSDLKLPIAGYRSFFNAGMSQQGTSATYWSSSPYNDGASYLQFFDGQITANSTGRANGASVRCFKN